MTGLAKKEINWLLDCVSSAFQANRNFDDETKVIVLKNSLSFFYGKGVGRVRQVKNRAATERERYRAHSHSVSIFSVGVSLGFVVIYTFLIENCPLSQLSYNRS